jgi:ATP-dependent Lhr-like helicase
VHRGRPQARPAPCVVATAASELGIDMGAVDLVVQIESPAPSVGQRPAAGAAAPATRSARSSRGVPAAQAPRRPGADRRRVERMRSGAIEALHVPTNPLDVLAQQVVAARRSTDSWDVDTLFTLVRRSARSRRCPRSAYDATPRTCSAAATRPTSSGRAAARGHRLGPRSAGS